MIKFFQGFTLRLSKKDNPKYKQQFVERRSIAPSYKQHSFFFLFMTRR
jgi:hypothetical protein